MILNGITKEKFLEWLSKTYDLIHYDTELWFKNEKEITKEANLIHKKIFDLENSMQVSAIPLDEKYYSKYQEFLNYITASSNVLGL